MDDKLNSGSSKTRFLEIDINSKFIVNLIADEQRLFKKARIQKALRNCYTDSEKWCQQLKVIHHIYPRKSHPEVVDSQEKPMKRTRKLSLGDKKTVKSASFRYSTSYGLEDAKPSYRPLQPNEVYHSKSTTHVPPVYLNITCKPNEENCSSLPMQKSDRSQFENEILQSVLCSEQQHKEKSDEKPKERQFRKNMDSSYHKLSDRIPMVTSNENKRVTKIESNSRCSLNEPISKISDLRYRVIKKENTYIERDFSKVARQPVYKTQVMVKIDDSYSDAVDAIRSRHSSKDNIYAEINEYQTDLISSNFSCFPRKSTCFVSDNCSRLYSRVLSTSTVNAS